METRSQSRGKTRRKSLGESPERRTRLTVPRPFNLQSEALSAAAKEKQKRTQQAEEEKAAKLREFKAKESTALSSPFALKASSLPLTVPESPALRSSSRAEARQDFEVEKKQRLEAKRKRKEAELAQKAQDEEAAVLELRKKTVFKARPFVDCVPMLVKKSDRPLTLAKSPMVRRRGKRRAST